MLTTQEIGKRAEQQACNYLEKQGLQLLQQNYRCRAGEIDLIMLDQDDIVFVEVRSRKRIDYGNAFDTVNFAKRRRLLKTAIHYLQMKKWLNKVNGRFDVIAIHPIAGEMQLEWIRNAFSWES